MAKVKLTGILLEEAVLTPQQLKEAQGEHQLTGASIQSVLLGKGWVSDGQWAQALAKQLDVPFVKLSLERIDPQVVRLVPEEAARRFKAVAVKMEGESLIVAFSSPLNLPAVDELKLLTGCGIKQMVATEKEIEQAIAKYYRVEETSKQALIDMRMKKHKEKKGATKSKDKAFIEDIGRVEDIPVVRLVNDIVQGAIRSKASDIHLEPQDPEMIVRYRVDGVLHDIMNVPKHVEQSVISRLKIMANMDITERRKPQDGHIAMSREGKDYDIRVSTMLAINGEKMVMRLLDRNSMMISLEQLGIEGEDKRLLESLMRKPYGMILVTGPTGSGKTTTLNAIMSQLDSKTANIVTVEDPVEYRLNRVTQIQVDPAAHMTFAKSLRTILRQDPDIIMVGEIRDKETAELAIQAALTGHVVFSTLHTNDSASAVTRLVDMGVEPFLIASTVIGAVAQRLVRKICKECREDVDLSAQDLTSLKAGGMDQKTLSEAQLVRGRGCDYCFQTGFKGRLAIYEILKISDEIQKLILENKSAAEIKRKAIAEGMKTLQVNGMKMITQGESTLEEVRRVVYVE